MLKHDDCRVYNERNFNRVFFRVFALHEKCVQLKAEYNLALQQVKIQRIEAEKQKQANIVHTDEYKFLQRCVALAEKYQASRID